MKKYKVLVFGTLPIATKIVMHLEESNDVELVGVVTTDEKPISNDPWKDVPLLNEYVKSSNIPVYKLEDLPKEFEIGEIDLGITCRYGKILKKPIIDLFDKGVVNLHGGLLPEFGGLYSANFTLLYDSSIGGGTIHFIDEGIDTGNILRRCEFQVEEEDTALTIFQKTQEVLFENLKEIIPLVLENKIESVPASELIEQGYPARYFNRSSLNGLKEIKVNELNTHIGLKIIKAFDFPGHEPAYVIVDNKKIFLRTTI